MPAHGVGVGAAKHPRLLDARGSKPLEGVVEHGMVDEGERDLGLVKADRAKALDGCR